ncbi:hypothetical protein DPMN_035250 [Dreissena polymorpha]|uniref:Uncharacterized protein n=1 Tax=Dreissena polymorpha TaxID=45954 RepID=A0A9D4MAK1_DREPO|nr:hypothetical protein DPMN_035250 [Dreissena polymorpha]
MSIRTNDETEHKQKAYVVVMGNEMIKQLEPEKSALHRRVKYLKIENNEIELRVIELERKSKELNDYTSIHDEKKSSYTAPLTRRDSFRHRDRDQGNVSYRDRETQSGRNRELQTNREDRHSGKDQERLTDRELDRRIKRLIDDRPPSGKVYD